MKAMYSRDEKQKMRRSVRTVESTGLTSRNCFPIFLDKEVCCHHCVKNFSVVHSNFWCGFEKMLNVFRDELREAEAYREEDIAPLMDPDTHNIISGQVMVTFRRRNKRLHEWVLETDLFKSLLLCICLQFR